MTEENILRDVGVSVVAAVSMGIPAHLLGVPLLLAYIAAGILLGPHMGLSTVQSAHNISTLSQIGLILLMFILGLEIQMTKLVQAGRAVIVSGLVQVLGSVLVGGILFCVFIGDRTSIELLYLSVAVALSSTLVVVKMLSDRMEIDSLTSRITLGILVIQDIFAISFIAIQPNLQSPALLPFGLSIFKAVGMLAFALACAKYILPKVFSKTARQPELLVVVAMGWCFFMCGLANTLSLSLEMGALVAGIVIASFPYHVDLAAKISSLRDFFITLFFVSIGLQLRVPTMEVLSLSVLLLFVIALTRMTTIFPVLNAMGYGHRTGLLTTLNLTQISELSLVLATLGMTYGHIGNEILEAFVLTFVVSSLASSWIIPKSHVISQAISRFLGRWGLEDHLLKGGSKNEGSAEGRPGIYILGFYRDASSLLNHLQSRYSDTFLKQVFVVDFNPETHHELQRRGIACAYGDLSHPDTLRRIDLQSAKILICTLTDHQLKGTTNRRLLSVLKALAPHALTIMSADTIHGALDLYDGGANYVYIPRIVGSYYMVEIIDRMKGGSTEAIATDARNFLKDWKEAIP